MGMVVRTNTMAQNAFRQLNLNNSAVSKSLQKLSSGFRINSAADDAAGLAISEKMKAQITGLDTAATNAQDGISLIQTAEGALNEVHNMLNRMVELSTKSANGTYSITEREALQAEVDSLLEEIDRVAESTNFNGINLLDGTLGFNEEAFSINTVDAVKPTVANIDKTNAANKPFPQWTNASVEDATIHFTHDGSQTAPYFEISLGDLEVTNDTAAKVETFKITVTAADNTTFDLELKGDNGIEAGKTLNANQLASALQKANAEVTIGSAKYTVGTDGNKLTFTFKAAVSGGAGTVDDPYTFGADGVVTDDVKSPSSTVASTTTGLKVKGEIMHDSLNVKNPIPPKTGGRAGIDFDFSKDTTVFADGNRLTIDGTTFVFKTSKESAAAAGKGEILIDVSDTAADGQLAEAIDIMSRYSTANFEVEVKNGTTIHIDQKLNNENVYDTRDSLTSLFTLEKGGAAAATAITLTQDKLVSGNSLSIGGHVYKMGKDVSIGATAEDTLNNLKAALYRDGFTSMVSGSTITVYSNDADATMGPSAIGGGLALQIGDTGAEYNMMMVSVADMGTQALLLDGLDITNADGARAALDTVKNAINMVSENRAAMGAMQNRLEYTINNLNTAVENMSAANSRIRDTDMAKEMMNYTQMNILTQAAQAMLAQANQQPQAILQLLQ